MALVPAKELGLASKLIPGAPLVSEQGPGPELETVAQERERMAAMEVQLGAWQALMHEAADLKLDQGLRPLMEGFAPGEQVGHVTAPAASLWVVLAPTWAPHPQAVS